MENIEFLAHTDHRYLKNQIDYKIKQKFKEYDAELNGRRERLRDLLAMENLEYDQELCLLLKARLDRNDEQRKEWIGLMRLEGERAEEELLKLKRMQRELENSEEYRHLKSRELLLDTKQAQLYQIAEKKVLREKQAKIDGMWLNVLRRLNEANMKREIYESKLQKCIADCNQEANCILDNETRGKKEREKLQLKEHYSEDHKKAQEVDRQARQSEDLHEWRKKLHQRDMLQRQIHANTMSRGIEHELEHNEVQMQRSRQQSEVISEVFRKDTEEMKNRKWHKEYLQHTRNETQEKVNEARELDQKFLRINGLCLPQPRSKRPYQKTVR